jgi:Raf kinase inhibitor-like YbhB/YbcL family protein
VAALLRATIAAPFVLLAVSCSGDGASPTLTGSAGRPVPSGLPILSAAFEDGGSIPVEFTCDGEDHSPPISWSPAPGAAEYALTVTDPDANGFVHWVVYGIPTEPTAYGAGETPAGAREGRNGSGDSGYAGPCPPEGAGPHRYEFRVYALSSAVGAGLDPGLGYDEVLDAIGCCVQVFGALTGTYARVSR